MEEMSCMLTQKNIPCVPVRIYIYFIFALPLSFLIFSPRPVNVLNVSLPKKFVSFVFFLSLALTFSLLSTTGGCTLT